MFITVHREHKSGDTILIFPDFVLYFLFYMTFVYYTLVRYCLQMVIYNLSSVIPIYQRKHSLGGINLSLVLYFHKLLRNKL